MSASGNSPVETSGYVPGVCNIGPNERQKRRQMGVISTVAAIVMLILLIATNAARPWRLLLFLPVTGAAAGLIQDRMHFCAGYGLMGVANVLKPAGETEDVTTAEFRKQDQRKALQIAALSVGSGAIVTVLALIV